MPPSRNEVEQRPQSSSPHALHDARADRQRIRKARRVPKNSVKPSLPSNTSVLCDCDRRADAADGYVSGPSAAVWSASGGADR